MTRPPSTSPGASDDELASPVEARADHAYDRRRALETRRYEIVLRGRLTARLAYALDGFDVVSFRDGETRLVGWVVDQSALHGALQNVQDLGLELVSVHPVDDDGVGAEPLPS